MNRKKVAFSRVLCIVKWICLKKTIFFHSFPFHRILQFMCIVTVECMHSVRFLHTHTHWKFCLAKNEYQKLLHFANKPAFFFHRHTKGQKFGKKPNPAEFLFSSMNLLYVYRICFVWLRDIHRSWLFSRLFFRCRIFRSLVTATFLRFKSWSPSIQGIFVFRWFKFNQAHGWMSLF